MVKSIVVEVDFEQRERNGPWHVSFNALHGDLPDLKNEMLAIRRLNGVFQAVREFIETRAPEAVVFIAKDDDMLACTPHICAGKSPILQV